MAESIAPTPAGNADGRLTEAHHADNIIKCYLNQDTLVNNWLKALLAVQSGLAIGFIYLFKDMSAAFKPRWFLFVLVALIPALGCIFAFAIKEIVDREMSGRIGS